MLKNMNSSNDVLAS